jgi:hypothetical protein
LSGIKKAAVQELIDKRSPEEYDAMVLGVVATNLDGQQFWGKLRFVPYSIAMKKDKRC